MSFLPFFAYSQPSCSARVTRALRGLSRWSAALAAGLTLLGLTLLATPAWAAPTASVAAPSPQAAAVNGVAGLPTTSTGLVRMPDGRVLAPEFARIVTRGELVVAVLG